MGKNLLYTDEIEYYVQNTTGYLIPEERPQVQAKRDIKRLEDRWKRSYPLHPVEGISPYMRTDNILKKFIGKPFSAAFSRYCEQVPVYQQQHFLAEVDPAIDRYLNPTYPNDYYLDAQGLIRKRPQRRYHWYGGPPYEVKSVDYVGEKRHKVTGKVLPEERWKTILPSNWRQVYPGKTEYQAEEIYKKDFVEVCVQGWVKFFDSKSDPEYIRLSEDVRKQHRKLHRAKVKEDAAKAYSFLTKQEIERKQLDTGNDLKVVRKGFDLVTSFRSEKED